MCQSITSVWTEWCVIVVCFCFFSVSSFYHHFQILFITIWLMAVTVGADISEWMLMILVIFSAQLLTLSFVECLIRTIIKLDAIIHVFFFSFKNKMFQFQYFGWSDRTVLQLLGLYCWLHGLKWSKFYLTSRREKGERKTFSIICFNQFVWRRSFYCRASEWISRNILLLWSKIPSLSFVAALFI